MSGEPRSVRWRRCLGLLPTAARGPGDDPAAAARSRRSYVAAREALLHDPRADEGDLANNNPLCANPDSSWARFFKNEELSRTVGLDLERLHPGDPFFSAKFVQVSLRNVLMVWALGHPSISYRQGMHEVAALLFSVLYSDACGSRDASAMPDVSTSVVVDAAASPCHVAYLEHDTASLFDAVMAGASSDGDSPGLGLSLYYEDAPAPPPGGPARAAPVHAALARIWAALAAVDAPLHAHLAGTGVEPQLFLLKWLRLLFGREFHFDDVVAIWDSLITAAADSHAAGRRPGELIEAMACAMILFLRPDLMAARDFGTQLRRLQKFPPVEHVGAIVERARAVAPAVQAVGRRPLPAAGGAEAAAPAAAAAGGLGFAVPASRRAGSSAGLAGMTRSPSGGNMAAAAATAPASPLRASADSAAARLSGAATSAARAVSAALEEDAAQLAGAAASARAALGSSLQHTLNAQLGPAASAELNSALDDLSTDLNAALGSIKASTRTALGAASPAALRDALDSSLVRLGAPARAAAAVLASPGGGGSPVAAMAAATAAAANEMRWVRSQNDLLGDELLAVPSVAGGAGGASSDASGASTPTGPPPRPVYPKLPPETRMAAAAAAMTVPIGTLDTLLSRMRERWSADAAACSADKDAGGGGAAAAAEDAALLAEALMQLRTLQSRMST